MTYGNSNLLEEIEQIRRREENTLKILETIPADAISPELEKIESRTRETIADLQAVADRLSKDKEN